LKQFQVVVIGSGPGGYVAAIRAGIHGLKTALIEKDPFLGGTCLHRGCIPTKALLHTAELYDEMKHADDHGISVDALKLDIHKVQERKTGIVNSLSKGIDYLMKKRKVEVFTGLGSFVHANTMRVQGDAGEETIRGDAVIIATGSTPLHLPHMTPDHKAVIDSDDILQLEEIPASLAVIGSGAVGVEFASIFRSFGSEVHVVELLPQLVPLEDEDVAKELEKAFRKRGIKSYVSTEVKEIQSSGNKAALVMEKDGKSSTLEAEKVLVAVGRRPVLDGLNYEAIGLALDGRHVAVDEYMRTNVPGVYAIGDIVKAPALAHVASAQGVLAVDHIAGLPVEPIDYDKVPNCTYSSPEIASIGLTEKMAKERGYEIAVGKFPFSAVSKARIIGDTTGFVKMIRDTRYDELLGVHIIGPRATELIAESALGMRLETTVEELEHTIHPHPTLSEAVMEAAHNVYGKAIHI